MRIVIVVSLAGLSRGDRTHEHLVHEDDAMASPLPPAKVAAAAAVVATPLAVVGIAMWRTHRFGRRALSQPPAPGCTIVVFGATALADGPDVVLRARLDHARDLYQRGMGERIAVAGGVPAFHDAPSGGHDEVAAGLDYLRARNIPAEDLVEVRPGQNTREQVVSTKARVIDQGGGPVIAVSSSYHLLRIAREAHRQGFEVSVSAPAQSADTSTTRLYVSHLIFDTAAVAWYSLPTSITRRVNTAAGSFRHLALLAMTGDVPPREAWRSLFAGTSTGEAD